MQLRRIRRMPDTASLQDPIETGREGAALTLEDTIPDDSCMEQDWEDRLQAQQLRTLLERLDARERQVLLLRYGLGGQPPLTQAQTAALLAISRSYVSRLETRALGQLKAKTDETLRL